MTTLILDRYPELAPLSQVALLRSWLNIAGVVGRGAGGPLGGLVSFLSCVAIPCGLKAQIGSEVITLSSFL